MAFQDAAIGLHSSSSGGGGIVTVYDGTLNNAASNINPAYFNAVTPASNHTAAVKKTREAMADFIREQQGVDGANASGVMMMRATRQAAATSRDVVKVNVGAKSAASYGDITIL